MIISKRFWYWSGVDLNAVFKTIFRRCPPQVILFTAGRLGFSDPMLFTSARVPYIRKIQQGLVQRVWSRFFHLSSFHGRFVHLLAIIIPPITCTMTLRRSFVVTAKKCAATVRKKFCGSFDLTQYNFFYPVNIVENVLHINYGTNLPNNWKWKLEAMY